MKSNKLLLPALFILTAIALISSTALAAENSVSLSYQLIDSELNPGTETTLVLSLTNPSSTLPISNVKLYAENGKHVSITPAYIEIGGIAPSTTQQTSFIIKAKPSAVSDTDYIKIRAVYLSSSSTTKESSIYVPVKISRDPTLQISRTTYSTSPKPGKETMLAIEITNNGNGDAKDITLTLNKSSLFIADNYEAFIKEIKAGSTTKINFNITINPSAPIGTHSVAIVFKYKNENKAKIFSEIKIIPLKITGDFNLIVNPEEYSLVENMKGYVTVKISNAGTSEARFLTLVSGNQKIYIGNLKSDDYDTENIELTPHSSGKYSIPIKLIYRDEFGAIHTENFSIEVNVKSMEEYEKSKPRGSGIETFAFVLFAALIIYYLYRKRSRKKR